MTENNSRYYGLAPVMDAKSWSRWCPLRRESTVSGFHCMKVTKWHMVQQKKCKHNLKCIQLNLLFIVKKLHLLKHKVEKYHLQFDDCL